MAARAAPSLEPTLLVGPLLRYADEQCATIWVETDRSCVVSVVVGADRFTAPTWSVHGHHYALVRIDHLAPCSANEYSVTLDDHQVWPRATQRSRRA